MRKIRQIKVRTDSHKQHQKILGIIGLLFLLHFTLQAQETQKEESPGFKNSISLGSFILLGNVQLNYERLIGERHGILTEGFYAFSGDSEGTVAFSLAYRYHFKKELDGLFASVFYRWGDVYFEADFEENGSVNSYEMQTTQNLIGTGIGYRKQWRSGLALVVRGGYGYQIDANYKWEPSEPTNQSEKKMAEALRGLDIEISLGYSF